MGVLQTGVLLKHASGTSLMAWPRGDEDDRDQGEYQQLRGTPVKKAKTVTEQQLGVLMALPGIGPVTARTLLGRFGSVDQIVQAETAALTAITGITPARAARLIEMLRSPYVPTPRSATAPNQP